MPQAHIRMHEGTKNETRYKWNLYSTRVPFWLLPCFGGGLPPPPLTRGRARTPTCPFIEPGNAVPHICVPLTVRREKRSGRGREWGGGGPRPAHGGGAGGGGARGTVSCGAGAAAGGCGGAARPPPSADAFGNRI